MSTASTANLEVWNAGDAGVVGLLHLAKKLRADGEDHLGDQTMDPQHPSGPAAVPIITTVAAVVAESRQPEPAPAAPAAAVAAQTAGAPQNCSALAAAAAAGSRCRKRLPPRLAMLGWPQRLGAGACIAHSTRH